MTTAVRLLRFLQPFWGWVAASVLLGTATIASGIGLLGTSAYLIAMAALQPSISVLQVAIVGVRFFGISRGGFRYVERLFSHSVNLRLLAAIRIWFYRSIEPLAPARTQSFQSGDVLSRVNMDIEALENYYVRVVSPVIVAGLVTVGVSIWAGQINWGFAVILLTGLILSGGVLPLMTVKSSREPGIRSVTARSKLTSAMVDGLQGMADLVAFRQEQRYLNRLEQLDRESSQAQTQLAWRGAWSNALNLFISNLTMLSVVILGGVMVQHGRLDGVMLAVLALVSLASFEAVQPLGLAALHLESSLQAGRRLFQLADMQPVVSEPPHPASPPMNGGISLQEVSFRYAPVLPYVLLDVNLDIASGQRVALVGSSGVGKTTLFQLLLRFWQPENGQILIGGKNLRDLSGESVRKAVGLMAQGTYLFSATLRQNLELAKPGASEAEIWQALRMAHLEDWARGLPQGLQSWVGEHGRKMSAGERQRLAIARLLLQDSPIVLLDEPTSHLDAITARHIHQTIMEVTRGKTVLWITHQRQSLVGFDRVVRLENGRITEVTT